MDLTSSGRTMVQLDSLLQNVAAGLHTEINKHLGLIGRFPQNAREIIWIHCRNARELLLQVLIILRYHSLDTVLCRPIATLNRSLMTRERCRQQLGQLVNSLSSLSSNSVDISCAAAALSGEESKIQYCINWRLADHRLRDISLSNKHSYRSIQLLDYKILSHSLYQLLLEALNFTPEELTEKVKISFDREAQTVYVKFVNEFEFTFDMRLFTLNKVRLLFLHVPELDNLALSLLDEFLYIKFKEYFVTQRIADAKESSLSKVLRKSGGLKTLSQISILNNSDLVKTSARAWNGVRDRAIKAVSPDWAGLAPDRIAPGSCANGPDCAWIGRRDTVEGNWKLHNLNPNEPFSGNISEYLMNRNSPEQLKENIAVTAALWGDTDLASTWHPQIKSTMVPEEPIPESCGLTGEQDKYLKLRSLDELVLGSGGHDPNEIISNHEELTDLAQVLKLKLDPTEILGHFASDEIVSHNMNTSNSVSLVSKTSPVNKRSDSFNKMNPYNILNNDEINSNKYKFTQSSNIKVNELYSYNGSKNINNKKPNIKNPSNLTISKSHNVHKMSIKEYLYINQYSDNNENNELHMKTNLSFNYIDNNFTNINNSDNIHFNSCSTNTYSNSNLIDTRQKYINFITMYSSLYLNDIIDEDEINNRNELTKLPIDHITLIKSDQNNLLENHSTQIFKDVSYNRKKSLNQRKIYKNTINNKNSRLTPITSNEKYLVSTTKYHHFSSPIKQRILLNFKHLRSNYVKQKYITSSRTKGSLFPKKLLTKNMKLEYNTNEFLTRKSKQSSFVINQKLKLTNNSDSFVFCQESTNQTQQELLEFIKQSEQKQDSWLYAAKSQPYNVHVNQTWLMGSEPNTADTNSALNELQPDLKMLLKENKPGLDMYADYEKLPQKEAIRRAALLLLGNSCLDLDEEWGECERASRSALEESINLGHLTKPMKQDNSVPAKLAIPSLEKPAKSQCSIAPEVIDRLSTIICASIPQSPKSVFSRWMASANQFSPKPIIRRRGLDLLPKGTPYKRVTQGGVLPDGPLLATCKKATIPYIRAGLRNRLQMRKMKKRKNQLYWLFQKLKKEWRRLDENIEVPLEEILIPQKRVSSTNIQTFAGDEINKTRNLTNIDNQIKTSEIFNGNTNIKQFKYNKDILKMKIGSFAATDKTFTNSSEKARDSLSTLLNTTEQNKLNDICLLKNPKKLREEPRGSPFHDPNIMKSLKVTGAWNHNQTQSGPLSYLLPKIPSQVKNPGRTLLVKAARKAIYRGLRLVQNGKLHTSRLPQQIFQDADELLLAPKNNRRLLQPMQFWRLMKHAVNQDLSSIAPNVPSSQLLTQINIVKQETMRLQNNLHYPRVQRYLTEQVPEAASLTSSELNVAHQIAKELEKQTDKNTEAIYTGQLKEETNSEIELKTPSYTLLSNPTKFKSLTIWEKAEEEFKKHQKKPSEYLTGDPQVNQYLRKSGPIIPEFITVPTINTKAARTPSTVTWGDFSMHHIIVDIFCFLHQFTYELKFDTTFRLTTLLHEGHIVPISMPQIAGKLIVIPMPYSFGMQSPSLAFLIIANPQSYTFSVKFTYLCGLRSKSSGFISVHSIPELVEFADRLGWEKNDKWLSKWMPTIDVLRAVNTLGSEKRSHTNLLPFCFPAGLDTGLRAVSADPKHKMRFAEEKLATEENQKKILSSESYVGLAVYNKNKKFAELVRRRIDQLSSTTTHKKSNLKTFNCVNSNMKQITKKAKNLKNIGYKPIFASEYMHWACDESDDSSTVIGESLAAYLELEDPSKPLSTLEEIDFQELQAIKTHLSGDNPFLGNPSEGYVFPVPREPGTSSVDNLRSLAQQLRSRVMETKVGKQYPHVIDNERLLIKALGEPGSARTSDGHLIFIRSDFEPVEPFESEGEYRTHNRWIASEHSIRNDIDLSSSSSDVNRESRITNNLENNDTSPKKNIQICDRVTNDFQSIYENKNKDITVQSNDKLYGISIVPVYTRGDIVDQFTYLKNTQRHPLEENIRNNELHEYDNSLKNKLPVYNQDISRQVNPQILNQLNDNDKKSDEKYITWDNRSNKVDVNTSPVQLGQVNYDGILKNDIDTKSALSYISELNVYNSTYGQSYSCSSRSSNNSYNLNDQNNMEINRQVSSGLLSENSNLFNTLENNSYINKTVMNKSINNYTSTWQAMNLTDLNKFNSNNIELENLSSTNFAPNNEVYNRNTSILNESKNDFHINNNKSQNFMFNKSEDGKRETIITNSQTDKNLRLSEIEYQIKIDSSIQNPLKSVYTPYDTHEKICYQYNSNMLDQVNPNSHEIDSDLNKVAILKTFSENQSLIENSFEKKFIDCTSPSTNRLDENNSSNNYIKYGNIEMHNPKDNHSSTRSYDSKTMNSLNNITLDENLLPNQVYNSDHNKLNKTEYKIVTVHSPKQQVNTRTRYMESYNRNIIFTPVHNSKSNDSDIANKILIDSTKYKNLQLNTPGEGAWRQSSQNKGTPPTTSTINNLSPIAQKRQVSNFAEAKRLCSAKDLETHLTNNFDSIFQEVFYTKDGEIKDETLMSSMEVSSFENFNGRNTPPTTHPSPVHDNKKDIFNSKESCHNNDEIDFYDSKKYCNLSLSTEKSDLELVNKTCSYVPIYDNSAKSSNSEYCMTNEKPNTNISKNSSIQISEKINSIINCEDKQNDFIDSLSKFTPSIPLTELELSHFSHCLKSLKESDSNEYTQVNSKLLTSVNNLPFRYNDISQVDGKTEYLNSDTHINSSTINSQSSNNTLDTKDDINSVIVESLNGYNEINSNNVQNNLYLPTDSNNHYFASSSKGLKMYKQISSDQKNNSTKRLDSNSRFLKSNSLIYNQPKEFSYQIKKSNFSKYNRSNLSSRKIVLDLCIENKNINSKITTSQTNNCLSNNIDDSFFDKSNDSDYISNDIKDISKLLKENSALANNIFLQDSFNSIKVKSIIKNEQSSNDNSNNLYNMNKTSKHIGVFANSSPTILTKTSNHIDSDIENFPILGRDNYGNPIFSCTPAVPFCMPTNANLISAAALSAQINNDEGPENHTQLYKSVETEMSEILSKLDISQIGCHASPYVLARCFTELQHVFCKHFLFRVCDALPSLHVKLEQPEIIHVTTPAPFYGVALNFLFSALKTVPWEAYSESEITLLQPTRYELLAFASSKTSSLVLLSQTTPALLRSHLITNEYLSAGAFINFLAYAEYINILNAIALVCFFSQSTGPCLLENVLSQDINDLSDNIFQRILKLANRKGTKLRNLRCREVGKAATDMAAHMDFLRGSSYRALRQGLEVTKPRDTVFGDESNTQLHKNTDHKCFTDRFLKPNNFNQDLNDFSSYKTNLNKSKYTITSKPIFDESSSDLLNIQLLETNELNKKLTKRSQYKMTNNKNCEFLKNSKTMINSNNSNNLQNNQNKFNKYNDSTLKHNNKNITSSYPKRTEENCLFNQVNNYSNKRLITDKNIREKSKNRYNTLNYSGNILNNIYSEKKHFSFADKIDTTVIQDDTIDKIVTSDIEDKENFEDNKEIDLLSDLFSNCDDSLLSNSTSNSTSNPPSEIDDDSKNDSVSSQSESYDESSQIDLPPEYDTGDCARDFLARMLTLGKTSASCFSLWPEHSVSSAGFKQSDAITGYVLEYYQDLYLWRLNIDYKHLVRETSNISSSVIVNTLRFITSVEDKWLTLNKTQQENVKYHLLHGAFLSGHFVELAAYVEDYILRPALVSA